MTIVEYILQSLQQQGCHYIFGVPGTSCAPVYVATEKTPGMQYVVTVNELEAGYMADGYARFAGLSAVAVSYGVGCLSMINAVASAYTEKVPMIVLNGGPTTTDQKNQEAFGILFSHSTGRKNADFEVYKNVTVASVILDKPAEAATVIAALFQKARQLSGPVYLEIPNNLWEETIQVTESVAPVPVCDSSAFLQAFHERTATAQKPVLLLGSELFRRNLATQVLAVVNHLGIPFCTTLLSKSIIIESHPLFKGTYDSDLVDKPARRYAEGSDCLIALGCIFGIDHTTLVTKQYATMIDASYGKARIGEQHYPDVTLEEVLKSVLQESRPKLLKTASIVNDQLLSQKLLRRASEKPTHDNLFAAINRFIGNKGEEVLMVADTCLSSYPAADLDMPSTGMFLSNPVWLSIGQGTPAAAGAYLASKKRPLIVTGDGGFQMIAQTYSTMVKCRIPAIIMIIDNGMYGIEQFLLDKSYYTDPAKPEIPFTHLNRWKYELFPEVFGGGKGYRVTGKEQMFEVLDEAYSYTDGPVIIAFEVNSKDIPAEYVKKVEEKTGRKVLL